MALFSKLKFLDKTDLFPNTSLFKLHGDLTTVERHDGMKKFIKSQKSILLTTDVTARGIDLKDIDWIIHEKNFGKKPQKNSKKKLKNHTYLNSIQLIKNK